MLPGKDGRGRVRVRDNPEAGAGRCARTFPDGDLGRLGRRLGPTRVTRPGTDSAAATSRAGVGRVDIIRTFPMDAFARWLVRHPLAVVLANLAVTVVL